MSGASFNPKGVMDAFQRTLDLTGTAQTGLQGVDAAAKNDKLNAGLSFVQVGLSGVSMMAKGPMLPTLAQIGGYKVAGFQAFLSLGEKYHAHMSDPANKPKPTVKDVRDAFIPLALTVGTMAVSTNPYAVAALSFAQVGHGFMANQETWSSLRQMACQHGQRFAENHADTFEAMARHIEQTKYFPPDY